MSCNIGLYKKYLEQGVDGAIVFVAENHTLDPLGYTAVIAGQNITVTPTQEGDDVVVTIPLIDVGLGVGDYYGYFVTNTKTEGNFFQFQIRLEITKNVVSD